MAYDCFISYASPDLAIAEELHRRLTGEGFQVWFEKARLQPGYDWHKEIEGGCEDSRVLLPVLTPRWKLSEWTRYETYGAEDVIPLLFEGAFEAVSTPPLRRFQAQALDFTGSDSSGWHRLFNAVRELLQQPPAERKAPRMAHLRYSANPYFVGREIQLNEIHEKLFLNPTTALTQGSIQAITALGGVGKTTLAREYAEKFWRCYRQMFWVDCRIGVVVEYARLFPVLFPERANYELKDEEKAEQVIVELKRADAPLRLLILDDASDEDSLEKWLPKTGNCHTLITSRFADWSPGIEQTPVWILECEPARELLLKRSGREWDKMNGEEQAACDYLAAKLGYLPLALEQAGAYTRMQGPKFRFQMYLDLYAKAENERRLLAKKTSKGTTEYPDAVYTTWRTTIDRLSPGARAILRLAAFMAPTPIPLEMFIKGASIVGEEARSFLPKSDGSDGQYDELDVREWKGELTRYSMIHLQEGGDSPEYKESFSVHGLVQAVERLSLSEQETGGCWDKSTNIFVQFAPDSADLPHTWPVWNNLYPHAAQLHRYSNNLSPKLSISLLDTLARFTFGKALHKESFVYEERAYELAKQEFGIDSNVRSISYGESLRSLKHYDEAEAMFRKSLDWGEKNLGHDHADVAISLNYLGLLLYEKCNNDEAEKCFREGLCIHERLGISEGRTHAKLMVNLAMVTICMGRLQEGVELSKKALHQAKSEFGEDDLMTLFSLSYLGAALYNLNSFSSAEPVILRYVQKAARILGEDHPDSIEAASIYAKVLLNLGELDSSISWFRKVIETKSRVYGAEDERTFDSVYRLADVLVCKNDSSAEAVLRTLVEGCQRILGTSHKITISSIILRASLLQLAGQNDEAEIMLTRLAEVELRDIAAPPILLRQMAGQCFKLGNTTLAEKLLGLVLERHFEVPSTHCHLCRICLLTERDDEARQHADKAWGHRCEAPPYVIPRILWLQLALMLLRESNIAMPDAESSLILGRLKTTLQDEAAHMEWTMDPVLTHLQPKLSADSIALLTALVAALSDRSKLPELERFPSWHEAEPQPLD
jgi:tetratricopeptide (TPR) repeat protein